MSTAPPRVGAQDPAPHRIVRLAAVQLPWHPAPERLADAVAGIADAGRRVAHLAVLPEVFTGTERPEVVDGPVVSALAQAAARAAVAVVAPLLLSDPVTAARRNSALVFDRTGRLVGRHDSAPPGWAGGPGGGAGAGGGGGGGDHASARRDDGRLRP